MLVEVGAERRNFSSCWRGSWGIVLVGSKYLVRCLAMSLSRSMWAGFLLVFDEREFDPVGVAGRRLPFAAEQLRCAVEAESGRCGREVAVRERHYCLFERAHRVGVERGAHADAPGAEPLQL